MQEQAVQGDGFRLEGVELDLGELAFLDFAPAIDAGLGFLSFTAIQAAQEFVGIFARGGLAVRGTREGFDRIAAQEFAPVVIEQVARRENVAPSDFAAVSHNHSDDAFILQAGSGLREAALHFVDEIIDGYAHGTRLVNFFVGFRATVASDGCLEIVAGNLRARSGWSRFGVGAVANRLPNFGLGLIYRGAFANAWVDDGIRGGELRAAGPTAVLDAENVKRKRRRADGNDTVLANDAVLLAAADELASEEQKRTLAAIDQNKLVDGSASRLRSVDGPAIARTCQTFGALLPDEHFAGGKSFLKSEKETGVLVVRTDYRKDGNVLVSDRIKKPPFPFRVRRWSGGRAVA